MKRLIYIFIVFLLSFNSLLAQPTMISDDFENVNNSRFLHQFEFNNQFVFSYEDSTRRNIWITDGTNITNLTENISDNNFASLQATNNALYFVEYDGEVTVALWKSDGTLNGQQKVWEDVTFQRLHTFQDKLFAIVENQNLYEFWVLDNDIPLKLMDNVSPTFRFTEFNNELYFFSKNQGLIKTDGTISGTIIVKPYDIDGFYDARLYQTAIQNGELYFRGCDTQHGCELWKTDGTTTGTTFVKDLNPTVSPTTGKPNSSYPSLMVVNNEFYIYDYEGIFIYNNQNEVIPLLTFESFSGNGRVYEGTSINNIPIFVVETYQENGKEIWTTDGTVAGTKILKEINRSAADGLTSWSWWVEELNGHLYFQGNDGIFGDELWRTDGTTEGTELVYDLSPRGASSNISNAFAIGNDLYFSNRTYDENGIKPVQLWHFPLDNFTPQRPSDYRSNDEWLSSIYGGYYNQLNDFKKDKNDNVYVAILDDSYFINASVFFDQDTIIPRSQDLDDDYKITIGKISKNNAFQWADIIYTNTNAYMQNSVIAPDDDENLYVAGLFENEITIGGVTITDDYGNLFIAKYDKFGQLLWTKTGKVDGYSQITEMLVNKQGEVFLAGFMDKITYQGKTFGNNNSETFVLKLDSNGNFQWANVGTIGARNVKISFTPQEDIILASSAPNIHIRKINKNGVTAWKKMFSTDEWTILNDIGVSSLGDIFLVGEYRNELNFDGFMVSYINEYYKNAFLAKFNSSGEVLYLTADESTISSHEAIEFDSDNNFYLVRQNQFSESRSYENWERYRTPFGTAIQQFGANGQLLKEREILSSYGYDGDIEIGNDGNIFYADIYSGQLDIFASSIKRTSNIDKLIFILQFSMDKKMETFETIYTSNEVTILPNPMTTSCTIQSHTDKWRTYRLNIYNSDGQLLRTIEKNDGTPLQTFRVTDFPTGILIFQLDNGTERISRKVLKH